MLEVSRGRDTGWEIIEQDLSPRPDCWDEDITWERCEGLKKKAKLISG